AMRLALDHDRMFTTGWTQSCPPEKTHYRARLLEGVRYGNAKLIQPSLRGPGGRETPWTSFSGARGSLTPIAAPPTSESRTARSSPSHPSPERKAKLSVSAVGSSLRALSRRISISTSLAF